MSEAPAPAPLPDEPVVVPPGRPLDQRLHESTAALAAEAGAAGSPGGPPGSAAAPGAGGLLGPDQVAGVRPFNEAATRTGLTILVDAANETLGDKIRTASRAVVETPAQAEAYADRCKLPPALKDAAVTSAVELCRENSWNLGPGWALGGIALEWMRRIGGVTQELEQLARMRARAVAPPEAKDAAKP